MELPRTASTINGRTSLVLNDDLDETQPVRARTTSHTTDNYLLRSAINLSDFLKFFYQAESRRHMTRHATAECCATRLRHLLQAFVQSPCLSRDEEKGQTLNCQVGKTGSVGTPCQSNDRLSTASQPIS